MDKKNNSRYQPIGNYGIIGNQHTIALIGKNGSLDFMCFPQFDSPSIFASLLDSEKGGKFEIKPQLEEVDYKQLYLPDTNVLLTRFLSYQGMVEITDFMPVKEKEHNCTLIRKVTSVRGKVKIKMECSPRFNYARSGHTIKTENKKEIVFQSKGKDKTLVRLMCNKPIKLKDDDIHAEFSLKEKDSVVLVLELASKKGDKEDGKDTLENYVETSFQDTVNFWKTWIGSSTYKGRWMEMVHRSALTLKLLTSYKHGSTVAAPTFSLPEVIDGKRNWDYRYIWIRDAAFTMYALIRLGYTNEAGKFMKWIRGQFEKNLKEGKHLQLMYSLNGDWALEEEDLNHLEGYAGSKPVRIGNNAYKQMQLDIYGELMDSIYLYDKHGLPVTYDFWTKLVDQIDYVCDNWKKKDHGIWEIRSEKQEFLYSRVMCWVAVDRAVRLAEKRSFPYPLDKWRNVRNQIFEDVYHNFWNEDIQSFAQYKGCDFVDASALIMPLVRFISPYDPKWQCTMKAIEKELVSDTLVYRYNTKYSPDGFDGKEGTFSICSFWYVECLARGGQVEKARLFFEKMLGYANHLGLFAEEIGLRGEQLGNFPQAFTHLSLISAAFTLNRMLSKEHVE